MILFHVRQCGDCPLWLPPEADAAAGRCRLIERMHGSPHRCYETERPAHCPLRMGPFTMELTPDDEA